MEIFYLNKNPSNDKEKNIEFYNISENIKNYIESLNPGDKLSLNNLQELGNNLIELKDNLIKIRDKGLILKIKDSNINTSIQDINIYIDFLKNIIEFENDKIKIKRKIGILRAKEENKYKGRKKGSISLKQEDIKKFKRMLKTKTITEIAEIFQVSRSTIYTWKKYIEQNKK